MNVSEPGRGGTVHVPVLPTYLQVMLAADEGEALAHLQQHVLDPGD